MPNLLEENLRVIDHNIGYVKLRIKQLEKDLSALEEMRQEILNNLEVET